MIPQSRIAPTPSGYLHEGNSYNFLLTWAWIRSQNGKLFLRVDNADKERCKPEYQESLFLDLDWLGIDWDEGPQSPADLTHFNQSDRKEEYQFYLKELIEFGHVFPCECSRNELSNGAYPGTCLKKYSVESPFAWRLKSVLPNEIPMLNHRGKLQMYPAPKMMNHSIIWRKDDVPAYQLVSVVEDLKNGINTIIRGQDLLSSSLFQLHLSHYFPENNFREIHFIHHPLLNDAEGNKLSKSKGSTALKNLREKGENPGELIQRFCRWMNLGETANTLPGLLQLFSSNVAK
ncbi:MAG: tRNA glutamyl-Q synthetase [Bacteroidetes bacterium]|nr:tRNA glutamyl-Q synthetase [Bacteroidota bacterium]